MRISEIIPSETEDSKTKESDIKNNLRVACPGIIESFDLETQTATVRLAINERLVASDNERSHAEIPPLLDVPIALPRAGGYALTMPIKIGDECLVIFADMCIDAWFANGGVQNQTERRRHDLSDGICIPGIWSQPSKIANYSGDSCQLRTDSGDSYIELKGGTVNIVAKDSINLFSQQINADAAGECALRGAPVTSNGLDINTHRHNCPDGTTTGPF